MTTKGWTGDIHKLIKEYSRLCKGFHKSDIQNPLIILIDNDKGSKEIQKLIQNYKKLPDLPGSDAFYYIAYNMYVVFLPKLNNQETDIESFYSKNIIDIELNGRFFEKSDKAMSNMAYPKSTFASHTVPQNQSLVDWSNFDQIFERIQLAIEDFQSRKILKI